MNMYMCMKINYINSPFIKLKVMASLCSHYFIGYARLPRRTTGIWVIRESKPLVAIDNLGWAISLRKLNRDLEGFVNNWRPNPFHTFTRRLFCYYEEVLNCPALRSTKSTCHQQFNWNNSTHTRIPLQLFAQFVAEPVKPWIISTCISLKHYVRPPLFAR